MTQSISTIQADFDRIALLSDEGWNQNGHYHNLLLSHLPAHCQQALEVGCGTGAFSRRLAKRSDRVLALDLSPEMIHIAKARAEQFKNIDFQIAEVMSYDFPAEQFDCIATIATLHHLPMAEMLLKMKSALKPGGFLLALDLFQSDGLFDLIASALAVPVNCGLRFIHHGRLRAPRAVRAVWAEHERHDSFLTFAQVRQLCAEILPRAKVRKHLLWRYSIIWKKET